MIDDTYGGVNKDTYATYIAYTRSEIIKHIKYKITRLKKSRQWCNDTAVQAQLTQNLQMIEQLSLNDLLIHWNRLTRVNHSGSHSSNTNTSIIEDNKQSNNEKDIIDEIYDNLDRIDYNVVINNVRAYANRLQQSSKDIIIFNTAQACKNFIFNNCVRSLQQCDDDEVELVNSIACEYEFNGCNWFEICKKFNKLNNQTIIDQLQLHATSIAKTENDALFTNNNKNNNINEIEIDIETTNDTGIDDSDSGNTFGSKNIENKNKSKRRRRRNNRNINTSKRKTARKSTKSRKSNANQNNTNTVLEENDMITFDDIRLRTPLDIFQRYMRDVIYPNSHTTFPRVDDKEIEYLQKFVAQHGLTDFWSKVHPLIMSNSNKNKLFDELQHVDPKSIQRYLRTNIFTESKGTCLVDPSVIWRDFDEMILLLCSFAFRKDNSINAATTNNNNNGDIRDNNDNNDNENNNDDLNNEGIRKRRRKTVKARKKTRNGQLLTAMQSLFLRDKTRLQIQMKNSSIQALFEDSDGGNGDCNKTVFIDTIDIPWNGDEILVLLKVLLKFEKKLKNINNNNKELQLQQEQVIIKGKLRVKSDRVLIESKLFLISRQWAYDYCKRCKNMNNNNVRQRQRNNKYKIKYRQLRDIHNKIEQLIGLKRIYFDEIHEKVEELLNCFGQLIDFYDKMYKIKNNIQIKIDEIWDNHNHIELIKQDIANVDFSHGSYIGQAMKERLIKNKRAEIKLIEQTKQELLSEALVLVKQIQSWLKDKNGILFVKNNIANVCFVKNNIFNEKNFVENDIINDIREMMRPLGVGIRD